ncbi:MAG: hypothetical protein MK202_11390 [Tenacibaculum sp.]|nr:hypothetical protein [Tenacibaculum sp.]
MKIKQPYFKGKSVFIVSLIVIVVTILTVYFTGINYNRSITNNFYISLGIIATALFSFVTYGLYTGIDLIDNFPKIKSFKPKAILSESSPSLDSPFVEVGDGIGGIIVSIVLWIVMSIVFVLLLALLEVVFWFSLFIILGMLYWLFFRALKLVFNKSNETKGSIQRAIFYALSYTTMYVGWLFGIVYLVQVLK